MFINRLKLSSLCFGTLLILVIFICFSCSKDNQNDFGNITGIVTDKVTGEPISGANITLSPTGLSKTSGSDGRYEFLNVKAQQYSVQGQAMKYDYNVRLIVVTANQTAKCDIPLMPQ